MLSLILVNILWSEDWNCVLSIDHGSFQIVFHEGVIIGDQGVHFLHSSEILYNYHHAFIGRNGECPYCKANRG